MQNRKHLYILIFLLILVIIGLAIILYLKRGDGCKTAYVRLEYVFSNYVLTKEVRKEVEKEQNFRKSSLDSIEMNLKIIQRNILKNQNDPLLKQRYYTELQLYNERKQDFSELNNATEQKYEEDVWNRINIGIQEYGELNSFELILGAKGDGNIMYASNKIDITEEVLSYLNRKYENK